MTSTIWTNVNLITMQENGEPYGLLMDAALVHENGIIVWIGSDSDIADQFDGEIVDCSGAYMSPGLIDPHTHLIYGGNRIEEFEMRLNGASYEELAKAGGGILSTVKATRAASETELVQSATKRLASFIAEGVTTMEIKSGYGLDLETELKMLSAIKTLGDDHNIDIIPTFLGAHALPPEYAGDREGYIDLVINEMLPKVSELDLASTVDGFCENIGFSYAEMERVFIAAKELGFDLKLHAEQLSDQSGAELAARYGALSADHLEYLSEDGAIAMKKAGTVAVLLPGAVYTLRETKLPPLDLLQKHGVAIAIGSDSNPGSSPMLSLKLMINMASTIFKLTPEQSLAGVTRNAAMALGLDDRGVLAIGKKADMVLWDITHPAELAYHAGGNQVIHVIKNGEIIS